MKHILNYFLTCQTDKCQYKNQQPHYFLPNHQFNNGTWYYSTSTFDQRSVKSIHLLRWLRKKCFAIISFIKTSTQNHQPTIYTLKPPPTTYFIKICNADYVNIYIALHLSEFQEISHADKNEKLKTKLHNTKNCKILDRILYGKEI